MGLKNIYVCRLYVRVVQSVPRKLMNLDICIRNLGVNVWKLGMCATRLWEVGVINKNSRGIIR